jgi:hypothetical protein
MIMLRLDRPYDLPQERFGEFLNATILNLRHFFRPVASLYQAQDLAKLALALGFRPDPFNSIQDINKLTSIQVVALGSLDFLKFFLENQFLNEKRGFPLGHRRSKGAFYNPNYALWSRC